MKTKIGLVQINTVFSGQTYFPYSVGLLKAYADRHCPVINEFEFVDYIYKRLPVTNAVNQLKDCAIVGFSIYGWNERLSLEIARQLKKVNQNVIIIFGGPQVPNEAERWLRSHPFIDIAVHGEGEHIFTLLLKKYVEAGKQWPGEWGDIPSISYISGFQTFYHTPQRGRFKNLDEIPSPYIEGTFESLIQKDPSAVWLALWETNRGCPFSCTYCDWGSATQAKVNKFDIERLKGEVDWFAKNKIEFIYCCDANYGILPRDIEITRYVVDSKKKTGYPKVLSTQNTKNATERAYEIQKLLASEGLNKGVTLAIQTMDKMALQNIKRENISLDSYQELQRRFMRDNIETYSDMILALPGETYDSFLDSMDTIITNGQHNRIQFGNLTILPNAEMGNPAYQKKFGMISVPSKIINMHGSLDETEDGAVQEIQQMVIGTDSMPKEDWIKIRSTCWMAAFLHFDKLCQIPLVVFHQQTGIRYRTIFEAFMDEGYTKNFPILDETRRFFLKEAINIQNGGSEFCQSKKWLNLFWPHDEYMFIKLVEEKKIHQFYSEALGLLQKLQGDIILSHQIMIDAISLNRVLLKIPFETQDERILLSYNIMEYYRSILENSPAELKWEPKEIVVEKSKNQYLDWNEWLQKVVWYGNKKGGYLHGNYIVETERQLSGHR